jgi:hypothetical protein
MKVYDKTIDIRKNTNDNTYTISVAITDHTIIVKTITYQELVQLGFLISQITAEE